MNHDGHDFDNDAAHDIDTAIKLLRQEIAALQHELRRVGDALERSRSQELERRARQLRDNIALCERDLEQEIFRSGTRSSDE